MVNIDNLFKMISEKGITQSKLAESTSISTGNISDWKKGKSMPSAVKLDELATYFDCSVDYLLGRTTNPNSYSNNENSFNVGSNSTQNVGNYNTISTDKTSEISDDAREIDNILKSLPPKERVRFLSKVYDLEEEFKKKVQIAQHL